MKLAAAIGIMPSEFWEITPFELDIYARAYYERQAAENDKSITQAYLTSRWVWQKRINIKKFLHSVKDGKKAKKVMTGKEMLAKARALNAVFGGTEKQIKSEGGL